MLKSGFITILTGLAFTGALLVSGCSGGSSEQGSRSSSSSGSEASSSKASEEEKMIEQGLGVGPVKEVKLDDEINQEMAVEGEKLYQQNCTACHNPDSDKVGPSPMGIMERRKPEWIMNMILNPQEMVQKDPAAQELLSEYNTVMAQQITDRDKARKILEYFRTLEK